MFPPIPQAVSLAGDFLLLIPHSLKITFPGAVEMLRRVIPPPVIEDLKISSTSFTDCLKEFTLSMLEWIPTVRGF